jgi:choline dehydrogenase
VLARRLSEDEGRRVLLLEAGPDDRGISAFSIPMAGLGLFQSQYDWRYETVPQKHSMQGYEGKVGVWF